MCRCKDIISYLKELNFLSQTEGLLQIENYSKIESTNFSNRKRCLIMFLYKPIIDEFQRSMKLDSNDVQDETFKDLKKYNNFETEKETVMNSIINEKSMIETVTELCSSSDTLDHNACKVFVNNIPYKTKQRELWDFFEYFGKVLRVSIIQDRKTKRSRGFGFVVFSSPYDAEKAISGNRYELKLDGRFLGVKKATKRKGRKKNYIRSSAVNTKQKLKDAVEYFLNSDKTTSNEIEICKSCKFNTLCDSLIMMIFSYLPVQDRVKCELVCKRWQVLAIETWPRIRKLSFESVFNKSLQGLTDRILISLLKKGCSNLNYLDVSASPFLLTSSSLSVIGKICINLEILDLSQVKINNDSCRILGSKLLKIKELYLRRCFSTGEKGFWWLLKDLSELRILHITDNTALTGKCIYMLHDTIEELDFQGCSNLSDRALVNLSAHAQNLHTINFSHCLNFTDHGLLELLQKCSNVQKLDLKNIGRNVTSNSLSCLASLKHLRQLDISRNAGVTDSTLTVLSQHCPNLELLNIEACHGGITCNGISTLYDCQHLIYLNVSYLMKVCDTCLWRVAQRGGLQTLIVRSCYQLTNKGVSKILDLLEDLKYIDLSDCIYLNNGLLDELCPRSRENLITICIGGTELTDISTLQNKLSPCNVVTERKSKALLKHPNDITLVPLEELTEEELSDSEEEIDTSRPVRILPDDVGFDMSLDYPDVDEYGEKLWEVYYPENNSEETINTAPGNTTPIDESPIREIINVKEDEEEDWDAEVTEPRHWHIPESSLANDDVIILKDSDDDYLENDDPLNYEVMT